MATEQRFWLMIFDRLGGIQSRPFSIQKHAALLVRLILGITSYLDPGLSCYDNSISWLPCGSCPTQYLYLRLEDCREVALGGAPVNLIEILLNSRPFARRSILGRGTKCFSGIIISRNERTAVVVKDSWRSKGREAEWNLLKRTAHMDGVGKALFYCDTPDDTISRFRQLIFGDGDCLPNGFDRTFSRVVLEAYGPPIHHFETPLQLLQALRDATAGMSSIVPFRLSLFWSLA